MFTILGLGNNWFASGEDVGDGCICCKEVAPGPRVKDGPIFNGVMSRLTVQRSRAAAAKT